MIERVAAVIGIGLVVIGVALFDLRLALIVAGIVLASSAVDIRPRSRA